MQDDILHIINYAAIQEFFKNVDVSRGDAEKYDYQMKEKVVLEEEES